jgi:hypothetical protein
MVDGASYPRQGTRGGESRWHRSASDPPRGVVALPTGVASFDGDYWPHEGGLVAQGGSLPGTAVAERRKVWQQVEREQGRDDDGAKSDGSGFSFAAKCGGVKGGRWWCTWDCRPVGTVGDRSANDGRRGGYGRMGRCMWPVGRRSRADAWPTTVACARGQRPGGRLDGGSN